METPKDFEEVKEELETIYELIDSLKLQVNKINEELYDVFSKIGVIR